MIAAVLLSTAAGAGVYLLYTALVFGRRGVGRRREDASSSRAKDNVTDWLAQAGLEDVRPTEFAAVTAAMAVVLAGVGWLMFGSPTAAASAALIGALGVVLGYRSRRDRLREQASESWPQILEEVRVLTGSAGRSIPNALALAGRNAATEPMRAAFAAFDREWTLTTDLNRSLGVLKRALADPSADAVCETLLVAHEAGGSLLDRRLEALVDDRISDVSDRKEALARQAGARFARWFVLIVPLGMAGVGLSIGNGREAYTGVVAQVLVLSALALLAICWVWASALLQLPRPERVFRS